MTLLNSNKFPTIISNTCWGSVLVRLYGVEYNSPFSNSFIIGSDYIELVKSWNSINFDRINLSTNRHSKFDLTEVDNQNIVYPIINLDDRFEIHYPHYKVDEDVIGMFHRRLARMDLDNLLFKFSKSRLAMDYQLKEFCKLDIPYPRILITDDILHYIKYESKTLKVIQSRLQSNKLSVDDEPLESLHNLNYNFFGFKFDQDKLLTKLKWKLPNSQ